MFFISLIAQHKTKQKQ